MKAAEMRALITGASGGIGRALAQELHGRGASVLLVGRNAQALEGAAQALGGRSARVDWCAADLATAEGRARVVEAASHWGGSGINVLVNNAGSVISACSTNLTMQRSSGCLRSTPLRPCS